MRKIVAVVEVLDNWGGTKEYETPEEIQALFYEMQDGEWTDDFQFLTDDGLILFIDDILGEYVEIGGFPVYVAGE